MAIKLKNNFLKHPKLQNFLQKYALLLIALLCFLSIKTYGSILNLSNLYSQINMTKVNISNTQTKLENVGKVNGLSDTSYISYDLWLKNFAAAGSLIIYNNTDNLNILSVKPQESLNTLSKSLKIASGSKDYSRVLKFIIIDKSKGTFITNDVENIDTIKARLSLFSEENGELYNYVSKKGQWYNISYNSQGAPAYKYRKEGFIKNPNNYIEAYWFPQSYIYTKEDEALAGELVDLQKEEIRNQASSLNSYLESLNKNIVKASFFVFLYLILSIIILIVIFSLGLEGLLISLKRNPIQKMISKANILFDNTSTFFKICVYIFLTSMVLASSAVILLRITLFYRYRYFLAIFIFIYLVLILPKLAAFSHYIDKIIEGSDTITSGDLSHIIPEQGDKKLSRLAYNINKLNKGFKVSIEDQIKNEKLKSELVANVSHDLKTPLTSIINYTDILLRENVSEEEKEEFLKILNRKSLKLKKLIEDLFEISKITSGKVELAKESVDVIELLNQSIAEYSDTDLYNDKNLDFIIKTFSQKIDMDLDGNKMSRVFENIINNAIKYSLKDTRVYVEIESITKGIKISFKNISALPLNFDKEEIFERFTRGDSSRNSNIDGNGLGLAIARSIVELHGGIMYIDFDGDLFKSIIELYSYNN